MVKRSPPLWFFADSSAPSAYYTGWVPDCLIPFSASSREKEVLLSQVEANKNQAVWVDILIPAKCLSGKLYRKGDNYNGDKVFKTIPVRSEGI